MTKKLFDKVACFGDIHFGRRNNSKAHNDDCLNFIDWFCKTAKENNCDTCIMLGDWSDCRSTINVTTLNYSLEGVKKLSESFKKVYMITGNHDLFYREKRDLNSFPFADKFPNVVIVDEMLEEDNVAIVPWLVDDEWKGMKKLKTKYVFGHFELPNFYMNAMVEMADHGGLNAGHFPNQEYVFSGHFHKRQSKGNIHYIGNPFPHTFADVWDDDRGMMMLEWGGKPEYTAWSEAPKFRALPLSKLIEAPENYLDSNTFARVNVDIDISFEESTFLKDTFRKMFNVRELTFVPQKHEDALTEGDVADIEFETVDKIVITQLGAIESDVINKGTLIELYNSLT